MTIASLIARLPSIADLTRISKALAMLDAILCPEVNYRYFSFNCRWAAEDPTQMMASMSNGSGDDYFIWFGAPGVAISGFDHESAMTPALNDEKVFPGVLDAVPAEFTEFLNEPAFTMQWTSFCAWQLKREGIWRCGPVKSPDPSHRDPDGSRELLRFIVGGPAEYIEYADGYLEQQIDHDSVTRIYNQEPLTADLLRSLGCKRSLSELSADIAEIGYTQPV